MIVTVNQREEIVAQATSAGNQDVHLDQIIQARALHDHVLERLPRMPINLRVLLKVEGYLRVLSQPNRRPLRVALCPSQRPMKAWSIT